MEQNLPSKMDMEKNMKVNISYNHVKLMEFLSMESYWEFLSMESPSQ